MWWTKNKNGKFLLNVVQQVRHINEYRFMNKMLKCVLKGLLNFWNQKEKNLFRFSLVDTNDLRQFPKLIVMTNLICVRKRRTNHNLHDPLHAFNDKSKLSYWNFKKISVKSLQTLYYIVIFSTLRHSTQTLHQNSIFNAECEQFHEIQKFVRWGRLHRSEIVCSTNFLT